MARTLVLLTFPTGRIEVYPRVHQASELGTMARAAPTCRSLPWVQVQDAPEDEVLRFVFCFVGISGCRGYW